MDVNAYVHESLEKLRKLGIDALAAEKRRRAEAAARGDFRVER